WYREMEALSKEVGSLQEKMEARKIIDRAKGVLMDKRGMKEQDAFRWIQMQAMSSRKSMREIAEAVILTQDV
ncbi:MAG TPA: response regulator, partial [Armatimonadetes bacterium]|nr:response regulator [Armatimonadota bacterium]